MDSVSVICGVDEAGRGPWAGPVCAGAVILDDAHPIDGLADSKVLSKARRAALAPLIRARAKAFGLGWASAAEIDELDIRQATHLAMRRAIRALGLTPQHLLIDGNDVPRALPCPADAIVKGDQTEACISAASVLAKTARDALMTQADATYPGYGFAAHKGYGTKAHAKALKALGPCTIHRQTFSPVARVLKAHGG